MHNKSIEGITSEYKTDIGSGLSSSEVEKRLGEYGENRLKEGKTQSFMELFINQFKSILIIILLLAALVSAIIGEFTEGIVIMIIVVLNSLVGAKQEKSAGDAVAALKNMTSPNARVIRDGKTIEIESHLLVPGDIIELEAGNFVPADIRLIETVNLKIEESALTGESVAVEKDCSAILDHKAPVAERINSAFMSTIVTYGRAKGIVAKTGMDTEMGKIAKMLDEKDEQTPLQKKLNSLGSKLGITCLLVCVIIFALGFYRKMDLMEIFMVSISLAVAAVPEGLPAIVTVILALGMKKMVIKNVLVKNLGSVETLGSTTVICSDKTGTLTQNKMTVTKVFNGSGEFDISGTGYGLEGKIEGEYKEQSFRNMLLAGILCNDSKLDKENTSVLGDPTEGALLVMGEKGGLDHEETISTYPRLKEFPFDSERKMMSTVHNIDGKTLMFTKGAPDSIFEACTKIEIAGQFQDITDHMDKLNEIYMRWAGDALRVLCYAYKEVSENADPTTEEHHMVLCGMSGMIDPPREEAKDAIATCKSAGIRVIMITGDHAVTASAIGRDIGLLNGTEIAVTGAEIDEMSDNDFIDTVSKINVFSRVSPQHKVKIVDALRNLDQITAMTGDGVNDAPSLKRADIGIAMGITGTDVSKEAADMILTDDNFSSIVGAVKEGRVIFSNIRKFVSFLISCNIGEILLIFIAMLMGWGSPLAPIQLLWVNLITDSLPAFALGMEPEEDDVMSFNPRQPKAPIIDKKMGTSILFQSVGLATAALISFKIGDNIGEGYGSTFAFITLISGELLRAFSGRSENKSIFKTGFFGNKFLNYAVGGSYLLTFLIIELPFMRNIFDIHVLTINQLLTAFAISLIPFIAGEVGKLFKI
jgi:Ca2+-transporting ATPase